MKKRRYILNLLVMAALLVACNESLEDTYSDYAGDGRIRYVGKCIEFHATSGWERLVLNWQNNTDATVDNIKLIWTLDGVKDSILLPRESTTYELKNLKDGTYRFDICAVDGAGNESLKEITYGRPYTRDHEIMRAFTRGVTGAYFLQDKMVFFTDMYNSGIVDLRLKYKNTSGETKYYEFDPQKSYNTLITLDDVSTNPADSVIVLRRGQVEGCLDVITYDPVPISRMKNFSTGFVNAIHRRYGYSMDTKEEEVKFRNFVENVEELEFDYDMETFEDILYCPKIKKLVFGKNRYLHDNYITSYDRSLLWGNEKKCILALTEANKLLGMTIDFYGSASKMTQLPNVHYFANPLSFMTYKGYSQLPQDLVFLKIDDLKRDQDGNIISVSPKDPYALLDNLVDNDRTTRWSTLLLTTSQEHELQMELKEETVIRGIKVAQVIYTSGEAQAPYFMPTTILAQTSIDGLEWKNVTYFANNELGRGSGEVTLLPIVEGSRRVRFIRFVVRNGFDKTGYFSCHLGDVVPYK